MHTDSRADAAARLCRARTTNGAIDALPEPSRPHDEQAAYALQHQLHEHLGRAGLGSLAGHKIGCTTDVMQRYLGIAQPCAGGIMATTVHERAARVRTADYRRIGVECEIAVRLAHDVDGEATSRDALLDAVDYAMAAIEIVDDRYLDYRSIGVMTLIADDFFSAGCVLGAPARNWRSLDLAGVSGTMRINGEAVGSGQGADILGHPLNALAWIARRYRALEQRLRAGEFVLLGSVVQTQWLNAGDEVHIEIADLGGATLSVVD